MKQKKAHNTGKILAASVPLLVLMIVWLMSFSSVYKRLDAWFKDELQFQTANEVYFDDVLVLDIDDASIQKLQATHGVWPYKRDVYGKVLDYLSSKGAKTVVFDILFAEPREGDAELKAAVGRHGNAVFVASTPVIATDAHLNEHNDPGRLDAHSWTVSPHFPAASLQAVLLPTTSITGPEIDPYNIGIVDVSADEDGVLRSVPVIHKIGKSYLPALPLAVHQLNSGHQDVKYLQFEDRITTNGQSWPVDRTGKFKVYYPKNANSILSLSFYKVVDASEGRIEPEGADTFFKGKTIFVGSTAFKSDKVNTPRGMMSGTYLLAIVYQNLKHNLSMKPDNVVWNVLLLILALIPGVITSLYLRYSPWVYGGAVVLVMGVIGLFNWYFLINYNQSSVLLFPLLLVFFSYVFQVLIYSFLIEQQNMRLTEYGRELKGRNEQLEAMANTDTLTGLMNRRAFLQIFSHEMDRYNRHGTVFSVAVMDLDHFKLVNDEYGHQAGDDVLKLFSGILTETFRQSDIAARWGGEEFVALLPDTHEEQAKMALEKVRKNFEAASVETPEGPLKCTVSIGAAQFDDDHLSLDDVLAHADKALYMAKETGRNRICLYKGKGEA
ncbi:MAG: diguanylate cyclase [Agarilytica sp.]